jgi:hypothetical protein
MNGKLNEGCDRAAQCAHGYEPAPIALYSSPQIQISQIENAKRRIREGDRQDCCGSASPRGSASKHDQHAQQKKMEVQRFIGVHRNTNEAQIVKRPNVYHHQGKHNGE